MFTGIVRGIGELLRGESQQGDQRLWFHLPGLGALRCELGDSLAVNGCCLTVVSLQGEDFAADVSLETLRLTNLGALRAGSPVNWEPALRAGDALGGHLVSGHVDGLAEVLSVASEARSTRLLLRAPAKLGKYIARKGSVTLDGVSLTVNEVTGAEFGVNLVPHTCAVTTLGQLQSGQVLNLEVDTLARYLERLLQER